MLSRLLTRLIPIITRPLGINNQSPDESIIIILNIINYEIQLDQYMMYMSLKNFLLLNDLKHA
jgi:hypothetical protein